jgi:actin related protein 2/3 complex, subunit 1A/1B
MAAPEEYQIANAPITSHAFNADRSRQSILFSISCFSNHLVPELAVSLNSNDAQIMSRQGQEWKVIETLSEVLGFNTAPQYNQLADTVHPAR